MLRRRAVNQLATHCADKFGMKLLYPIVEDTVGGNVGLGGEIEV